MHGSARARERAGGLQRGCCMQGSARAKARAGGLQRAAWAVVAALRLPCDARSRGPAPNSLRSLRSLRSDSGAESDHETRCARRPQACAPRRLRSRPLRVPPAASRQRRALRTKALRLSETSRAGRRVGARGSVAACKRNAEGGALEMRALRLSCVSDNGHRKGACGWAAARIGGAEKRRARGRARSALRRLTRRRCLSAVSAANAASSAPGHETEHRRAVGAQRRPPRLRAAAHPHAPLLAPTHACNNLAHATPDRRDNGSVSARARCAHA